MKLIARTPPQNGSPTGDPPNPQDVDSNERNSPSLNWASDPTSGTEEKQRSVGAKRRREKVMMRLKALDSDAHVSPKCAESSEELTGAARTKIVEKTGGEVGASGSPTTTKVVAKVQASVKQKLRPRIRNRAGGEEGGKGPTDEIGSPIASSPVEGRRSEEQSMSSKSLSLLSRQEKISLDTVSSQVSFDCPVYTRTHRHFSPSTPPRKNEDERRTAESQHRVSRESGSLGEKREIRERKRQKSLSREGMKRRQRQTTEAFAQKRSRDRRRRVPLERERGRHQKYSPDSGA